MLKRAILLICLLPLADAFLTAQTAELLAANLVVSESPVPGTSFLIHKRVDEVRVVFSATDKHGQPVAGLRAEDVTVEDNGRAASKLASFSEGPGLLLRLTFLVDTSGSMAGSFRGERAVVQRWQAQLSNYGMNVADWTSFASKETFSETGLLDNRRPEGSTAMLDALGAEIRRSISVHEPRERRVIVLLSDGEDNLSGGSLLGVIAEAQRSNTAIYTIAAHSARLQFPGDRVLRSLSEATGGRFFLLSDYSQADSALLQMQSDLCCAYALSFHLPATASAEGPHTLVLRVRHRRGVMVLARKGYVVEAAN